ncbi:hypothetical protein H2137_00055 [Aeromonas hydrophila]|uniref:Uncharacterized protein n=1 Tax=Aeromonas hydrophila TaxID=644 RepID=A0A8I0B872_AERHY|nr:DNA-binding protein [Aeromonas hydrophila]MBC8674204.1 hypothetical protein [Aeromonas hydrophila]MBC8686500.1 hypothetical protein [Aeromonas hydrophila]
MEWFTSSELAGTAGMPTTDRQIRNIMKDLASSDPEKARQREGSKATEYHISILPPVVQAALLRKCSGIVNLAT